MKYSFLVLLSFISCSSHESKTKAVSPPVVAKDLVYAELSAVDKIKVNNCVLWYLEDNEEPYIDDSEEALRKNAYSQPDDKLKPVVYFARQKCLKQLQRVRDYVQQYSEITE